VIVRNDVMQPFVYVFLLSATIAVILCSIFLRDVPYIWSGEDSFWDDFCLFPRSVEPDTISLGMLPACCTQICLNKKETGGEVVSATVVPAVPEDVEFNRTSLYWGLLLNLVLAVLFSSYFFN
jgi:hypothetical protein